MLIVYIVQRDCETVKFPLIKNVEFGRKLQLIVGYRGFYYEQ